MAEAVQKSGLNDLEYFRSSEDKDPDEFWARLKQAYLSADGVWQALDWAGFVFPRESGPKSSSSVMFAGQTFADGANLSRVTFQSVVVLSEAVFAGGVTFADASFEQETSFDSSIFHGPVDFQQARFQGRVTLDRGSFLSDVTFAKTKFAAGASFENSSFERSADFQEVRFGAAARMTQATFQGDVTFAGAQFAADASFENGSFARSADFKQVSFRGAVDLHMCKFRRQPIFDQTMFDQDPNVTGATAEEQPLAIQTHWAGSRGGAGNDRVAPKDQLNFSNYIEAFVDLIRSADTKPPLTIGIFGSWGMGKSFLLDHIEQRIRELQGDPPVDMDPRRQRQQWRKIRRQYKVNHRRAERSDRIERQIVELHNELHELQSDPSADMPLGLKRQRHQWRNLLRWRARWKLRLWRGRLQLHLWRGQLKRAWRSRRWHDLLPFGWQVRHPTSAGPSTKRVHVVRFNAWEYSATDVIWPGLVRKIMDRLEVEITWGFPGHFLHRLWRNVRRQVRESRGRLVGIIAIAVGLVAFALWRFRADQVVVGFATLVALLLAMAKFVVDGLANPLSKWVTTLFEERDYGKQIGYMTDIREDLEFLECRLQAAGGRILITIDDLDRCEPEKSVEVLQAISLLLNFDSFIVCLGIDARVISRAVEDHYQSLLGPAGASGYEYLDKIVQIPFRIPEPSGEEIRTFLSRQMGDPQPNGLVPRVPGLSEGAKSEFKVDEVRSRVPQEKSEAVFRAGEMKPDFPPRETTGPIEETVAFTWSELQAFDDISAFLRPNPRHLKRLINVYRLVRTLARKNHQPAIYDQPATTVRWLAMCGQWPYTSYVMLHHLDELLEDKERYNEVKASEEATRNPLAYLYQEVAPRLSDKRQRLLDYDIALLKRLLDGWHGQLPWERLEALRRYTVNFNPAIEAEYEPPDDSVAQREAQEPAVINNAAATSDSKKAPGKTTRTAHGRRDSGQVGADNAGVSTRRLRHAPPPS